MKRPPLLIVLLVLAHGLVAISLSVKIMDTPKPSLWGVSAIPVFVSQIGLVSIWLCLGRTPFLVRLVATALVMWMWVWVCSNLGARAGIPWPLMVIACATVVTVFLFFLQWFGLAVERKGESSRGGRDAFQFSIGQMLVWMTVVAVSLGILKATGIHETDPTEITICLAIGFLWTPIALTSMWLALGQRWFVWRVAVAMLYPFLAAMTSSAIAGFGLDDEAAYLFVIAIAICCLLSLLVVRQGGYRIVRLRPEVEEEFVDVHPLDAMDGDGVDVGEETAS